MTDAVPAPARLGGTLVSGTLVMIVAQLVTVAGGWVLTPILLRTLGIERYGAFVFLQLILSYAAVADIGMGAATTRFAAVEVARGDARREATLIWSATAVAALSSGLLCLIVLGLWELAGLPGLDQSALPEVSLAAALFAAPFLLRQLSGVWNTPHTVRLRFGRLALINYGGVLLQQALVGWAAWRTGRLDVVVIAMTAAAAVVLIAHVLEALRTLPDLRAPRWSAPDARSMLVYGGFGVTVSVAEMLLTSGERILLTGLSGLDDLARYALANTVASMVMIGPLPAFNALLPALSRHTGGGSDDKAAFDALYRRALVTLLAGTLCCIAVLSTVARPLLQVWVGADLARGAAPVAVVLCAGMLPQVIGQLHGTLYYARGLPRLLARVRWMEVPVYALAGWLLIRQWGPIGAAAAWTLRWTADAIVTGVSGRRAGIVPSAPDLSRALGLLAVAVFGGIGAALRVPHVPTRVALGMAVAAGTAFYTWMKLLTPDDRDGLRRLAARLAPARAGQERWPT